MTNQLVAKELQVILDKEGLLRAEVVVEAARPRHSALHPYFTWDDTEAARLQRLSEARQLIRCVFTYKELEGRTYEMRAYCSLTPDRKEVGGGYRSMVAVMESNSLRDQRRDDLIAELQRLQAKIAQFDELDEVYAAIDRVVEKHPPRGTRHSHRSEAGADA